MKKTWMLIVPAIMLVWISGCRSAAEFMGFTGRPEGNSGWSHDYEATPQDVYEAFRLVMRDNGEITNDDPDNLTVEGLYKPHDQPGRRGINVKGTVYDRSKEGELRSRLIVHAWFARAASDRERPETAREYCNTVYHVLRQWRGEEVDEKPTVTTTSEEPVREDEAVGFFRVTVEQAMEVSKQIVELYGAVDQADRTYLRGRKQNPLEPNAQEVRLWVYDRTEEDSLRVKISVRVRSHDDRPLQDVARAYLGEIRGELQKRYGEQD